MGYYEHSNDISGLTKFENIFFCQFSDYYILENNYAPESFLYWGMYNVVIY
jgi:hypothetical protein